MSYWRVPLFDSEWPSKHVCRTPHVLQCCSQNVAIILSTHPTSHAISLSLVNQAGNSKGPRHSSSSWLPGLTVSRPPDGQRASLPEAPAFSAAMDALMAAK
eukprot:360542-Chlamydomonas_euryale.AAC.2